MRSALDQIIVSFHLLAGIVVLCHVNGCAPGQPAGSCSAQNWSNQIVEPF
jgi:hypothetical protein